MQDDIDMVDIAPHADDAGVTYDLGIIFLLGISLVGIRSDSVSVTTTRLKFERESLD